MLDSEFVFACKYLAVFVLFVYGSVNGFSMNFQPSSECYDECSNFRTPHVNEGATPLLLRGECSTSQHLTYVQSVKKIERVAAQNPAGERLLAEIQRSKLENKRKSNEKYLKNVAKSK